MLTDVIESTSGGIAVRLHRGHLKLLALAASCIAVGVGISAIATAGASATSHGKTQGKTHAHRLRADGGAAGRLVRRTVSGQFVVRTKTGWATVGYARGTVEGVSGQQLTLNEGTKKASYKTVTMTIPTAAKVRVNGKPSSLSAVTAGERAIVLTLPKRTVVIAHTPKSA
jgi:hypothetical protein